MAWAWGSSWRRGSPTCKTSSSRSRTASRRAPRSRSGCLSPDGHSRRRDASPASADRRTSSQRLPHLLPILLAAVASVWFGLLVAATPPLIVFGASVPAALYAGVIYRAQRGEGRPVVLLVVSLLWGVTGAAFLSQTTNTLARDWIGSLVDADHVRAITATLAAPLIEEGTKALILLLLFLIPGVIRGPRDGIIYGALVGIGFVLAENLVYLTFAVLQGGQPELLRAVYLRGFLAGGNHAVFTATIGAGIGWARAAPTVRAAALALLIAGVAALIQHNAWNAIAAGAITRALCGAEVPGGACRATPALTDLFVVAPFFVVAFLAPGTAALTWVAGRASGKRE